MYYYVPYIMHHVHISRSVLKVSAAVRASGAQVCGKVAYAPQTAFILNGTLRENVLFGNPWDPELYARVIEACCLQSDIDLLQAGDATEIGTGGINLSGGQRQRVRGRRRPCPLVIHASDSS